MTWGNSSTPYFTETIFLKREYNDGMVQTLTAKGARVMANPFVHVELATTDVAKAKDFYGKLFDWKLEDIPGMDYTIINVGEGTGGGIMKTIQPDSPSYWLAYVHVADAAAATEKARKLGATICKEVTEIPGIGWFSVITDPTGATLALWQMNPDYKPAK
jgi:predicted enzyme related to lactoylglutathione lyase